MTVCMAEVSGKPNHQPETPVLYASCPLDSSYARAHAPGAVVADANIKRRSYIHSSRSSTGQASPRVIPKCRGDCPYKTWNGDLPSKAE